VDWGESLTHIAELVAGAIGFEQLQDVVIGPLVQHGIKAVADMNARRLFRQHIPSSGDTAEMSARGIIPHALTNQLLSYDGLNDQLQEAVVTAAQQGISPRQLIQLLPTGLLTADDLTDELTFLGMRPRSQQRMQLVAPYLAARRERDNLRST